MEGSYGNEWGAAAQKEVTTVRCRACGSEDVRVTFVSEAFDINGRSIVLDYVPAILCSRCGALTFGRGAVEAVRRSLGGAMPPVEVEQLVVIGRD